MTAWAIRDERVTAAPAELRADETFVAFARLYEAWYPRVYRYCYYRIGSTDAEDATSEIFIGAWRNFASLAGEFPPWLFRIARNVCVDVVRRRKRRPEMVPLNSEINRPASGGDPEALGLGAVMHVVLRRALVRLPEEQRQVILLKFVAGLSNREVGQALGKSENAVNTQQFRALRALRRALAKEGYGET